MPANRMDCLVVFGATGDLAELETVEAAWRGVDPILTGEVPVRPYEQGTWGPAQAAALGPEDIGWIDPVV